MIKEIKTPEIKDATTYDLRLPLYTKYILSNGVEVYMIDNGNVEVMRVNWIFNAGIQFQKKLGVARAVNSLLASGTSNHDISYISDLFDFYGTGIHVDLYTTLAFVTLECLTKHSKELLSEVAEIICNSNFPEDELQSYKDDKVQELSERNKDRYIVAELLLNKALYGQMHPFAVECSAEDYLSLNRQDLLSFHRENYSQGSCFITVAGKLPADLIDQFESIFGTLPLKKFPFEQEKPLPPARPSEEKIHHKAINSNNIQTYIRLGKSLLIQREEDLMKLLVLNFILGGYSGSRLHNNIREDKGYVYSIESKIEEGGLLTRLIIRADTDKDNSLDAIKEIQKELDRLGRKAIKAMELRIVKNLLMGSLLEGIQDPFAIASYWEENLLKSRDEKYFYRMIDAVKNVTSDELLKVAQEYLSSKDFYVVTVT